MRPLARSSDTTITIAIELTPHCEDPDSDLTKFLALGQATRNEGAEKLEIVKRMHHYNYTKTFVCCTSLYTGQPAGRRICGSHINEQVQAMLNPHIMSVRLLIQRTS